MTATWSPDRGGTRNSNFTTRRVLGSSILSILSRALMRLCTCAALAAWVLNRSMKRCSLASMACWRGERGLLIVLADGALALVEIVVAGVGDDLAGIDLGDFGDDSVHELAV